MRAERRLTTDRQTISCCARGGYYVCLDLDMTGREEHIKEVSGRHPTVLIVEDEVVSRRALAALLGHSGFATTAVGSAEEALATLTSGGPMPKVALIDLDLPGMSGGELITFLARLDHNVIPIVISAADDERLFAATRHRGVAFLRKPLNFEHLLNVLSAKRVLH